MPMPPRRRQRRWRRREGEPAPVERAGQPAFAFGRSHTCVRVRGRELELAGVGGGHLMEPWVVFRCSPTVRPFASQGVRTISHVLYLEEMCSSVCIHSTEGVI
uniref:Uncharacterized protein n=1 Tax=Oryza punctata TaxID=4537 RepID=A0A0E0JSC8_ORYPU